MKELVNIFAGNPLFADKRSHVDPQALHNLLADEAVKAKGGARILPLFDGKPLVVSSRFPDGKAVWNLAWQPLADLATRVGISPSSISSSQESAVEEQGELLGNSREYDRLVYLGEKDGIPLFAMDVSSVGEEGRSRAESVASAFASGGGGGSGDEKGISFVDLRTLMMAADWESTMATEQLSIAGNARAMTEWHKAAKFCGRCGTKTFPMEAGGRRQCPNPACKQKSYPRTDPVVIMLIINRERDMVILGRQARFPSRMWSCLAGFLEAGESLEEAVRRETREEVGIEVGDILYHSSQPWPVGPASMSSQLMVGFFGYAKSFEIRLDGLELEDAQWFSREQVRQAVTYTDYKKQQESTGLQILQSSLGGERRKPESAVQGGAVMYVPGPYAIAHNLIATWVNEGPGVVLSKV